MNIEESYFIDVDLTDKSTSVVMIYKQQGSKIKVVNSFTGENAINFYKLLNGELKMEVLK